MAKGKMTTPDLPGPGPGLGRRRARLPTQAELELWKAVTKDMEPLEPERKATALPADEASTPSSSPLPSSAPAGKEREKVRLPLPPLPPLPSRYTPKADRAPQLTGLDRRTSQKLSRGQMEADVRIDLHGMTQIVAYEMLFAFLMRARAQDARLALVITGKGESEFARHTLHSVRFHPTPERKAVLRSIVPQWFQEERFRVHVAGFQPAHPRHGGGGAFYVWLRRNR